MLKLDARGRAVVAAFLAALTTLALQVLVHRMVSAKLLNNYAFLVISLTMLGFAFSGVVLSRWLTRVLADLDESLVTYAALCGLSFVVVSAAFYRADAGMQLNNTRPDFVLALFRWIPLALLYAIPFTFCGLILGVLLSAPDLPARRVYFFDLLGSALGAAAVVPAIGWIGVERCAVAVCALLLGGCALLFPPRRAPTRVLAVVTATVLLAAGVVPAQVFQLRYPRGSMLALSQEGGAAWQVEHVAWDPLARIEVSRIPPPDYVNNGFRCLIGSNRAFLARFEKVITQNNFAFTYAVHYDGTRESLKGIEETIYAAAYQATSVPRPRVLIIGVGGGFDVLNALAFDASDVTAVEVNRATLDILTRTYRDYFRHWVTDPRVHLLHGEGRNHLATRDTRYDVIQISGVDTYSGTPGAAHVFSENYLYTAEAFDLYLSRLTDGGILNVMRLEHKPPREMLKALITATEALRRAGAARPADHILTLTADEGSFTAVLVKKTPFTEAERRQVRDWTSRGTFFSLSAEPALNAGGANMYQVFLALEDPRREAQLLREYPYDVHPTTDNRPFFFRHSYWWHLFPAAGAIWTSSLAEMEYSILILVTVIAAAAVITIYLPLRRFAATGAQVSQSSRYGLFFAATGVGYLAIEMALIQKFGLLLGHPNYALSVVLATLLFGTGLGSLFSRAIVSRLGQQRFVTYVLALLILAQYAVVFPWLHRWIAAPFALRLALTALLVVPVGLLLGTFMPVALEQLKRSGRAPYVPWAWGINGIFSVLAPVVSIAFSMTWGINALLLAAIPVYLVAGFALPPAAADAEPPSLAS